MPRAKMDLADTAAANLIRSRVMARAADSEAANTLPKAILTG
ncbi:hypothetical protein [Paenibacillus sp. Leaf72]|nr:hypothetical protein [Paenibacillus sp. Leaf72]